MTAKRKAYLAVACTLIGAVGAQASAEEQAPAELRWGPPKNLERVNHRVLRTARKPVDSAACNLSDHALVAGLCRLAQAAVRVRVYQLRETLLAAMPSHPLHRQAQASNLEVGVKQAASLRHLKSYLAGSLVLRTASANFSAPGLKRQDNDVVVLRDARLMPAVRRNLRVPVGAPWQQGVEA